MNWPVLDYGVLWHCFCGVAEYTEQGGLVMVRVGHRRRLHSGKPPLPLPCCRRSPAFSLPYPLPLWAPSLMFGPPPALLPPLTRRSSGRGALPIMRGGGALFIHLLYLASLWAVLCVTPVLHTGYDVMAEGLTCSHGRVQYGCCVVLGTLSWPWMRVGRLRDTVPVGCGLCVHGDGVPADVCGASDDWCTGL